ncbi:MAG: MauE/DoxX family redox-associated membrane protein [Phycisphaerales bacterium JB052]
MALAMIAPLIELLFATIWIMGIRRRLLSDLITALIAIYTIALIVKHNLSGAVSCDCFSSYQRPRTVVEHLALCDQKLPAYVAIYPPCNFRSQCHK